MFRRNLSGFPASLTSRVAQVIGRDPGNARVWYDPNDSTTLFQDANGTVPVTAIGQPVGLHLDKSEGLVRGPESAPTLAAANWATNSGDSSGFTFHGDYVAVAGGTGGKGAGQVPLVAGRVYEAVFEIYDYVSGSITRPYDGAGVNNRPALGNGWYSHIFTAVNTTPFLYSFNFFGKVRNVSIRALPGNHRSQPTAAKRPTLEARVNLFTASEFPNGLADAGYRGGSVSLDTIAGYGNAIKFGVGAQGTWAYKLFPNNNPSHKHTFSCVVEMDDGLAPSFGGAANANTTSFQITIANVAINPATYVIQHLGGRLYRVSATGSGTHPNIGVIKNGTNDNRGFKVTAYQLEEGPAFTTYQKVVDAKNYVDVGAPRYLLWDGADDSLYTRDVDFSGTNGVTVATALLTLGTGTGQVMVEHRADTDTNNGAWALWAPAGNNTIASFLSKGTASAWANQTFSTGDPTVLSGVGSIGAPSSTVRVNGVGTEVTTSQGAGNYGTGPLYFGARLGGTTYPREGRDYGTIIVGRALSGGDLAILEQWLALKSGATLA